jgi:acyl carrier protein
MTNSDSDELVRLALGMHFEVDLEGDDIEPTESLRTDLGLDDLDILLIALRLEELGGIELDVAALAFVETVADLELMVHRANRRTPIAPTSEGRWRTMS